RRKDVAKLMRDGTLDPESNMNYGEGGAGTFTDGKLYTRVHDPLVRKVMEDFARFGAPQAILVEAHPHIGSDLLPPTVVRLREALIAGGCEVRFGTRVLDLAYRDGKVAGVLLADGTTLESDRVVLAPGNSARELYERFVKDGRVRVDAKAYSIGFRAEHPQELIDRIQYGKAAGNPKLRPSEYKLAENLPERGGTRGVYSFCMCPGGLVVPTPTEQGYLVTNGMSNSRRNAKFANAGMVVSVGPEDFEREGFQGPLGGLEFQRHWEKKAFELGGGGFVAPAQSIPDYLAGRLGREPGKSSYRPSLARADLNGLLPGWLNDALKTALRSFGRRMRGFVSDEGTLIALESRTSAPLRVTRGGNYQSVSLPGLYPAGEGCGYAGGIVSSAIDGLRIAEQIGAELS
ncbi:MAG: NAD(P)/FAD-dependent oxidoreductase, partial [Myxococcaceae bacterium]